MIQLHRERRVHMACIWPQIARSSLYTILVYRTSPLRGQTDTFLLPGQTLSPQREDVQSASQMFCQIPRPGFTSSQHLWQVRPVAEPHAEHWKSCWERKATQTFLMRGRQNPLSNFQVTSSAGRVCLCRAQHHKTYLCLREVFLWGSSRGAAALRTWGIPRVQPYFHSAHSSDSAPRFPTSCWAVRHRGRADEQEQERSSHSSLQKKSGRSSYRKSLLPKMKRG